MKESYTSSFQFFPIFFVQDKHVPVMIQTQPSKHVLKIDKCPENFLTFKENADVGPMTKAINLDSTRHPVVRVTTFRRNGVGRGRCFCTII